MPIDRDAQCLELPSKPLTTFDCKDFSVQTTLAPVSPTSISLSLTICAYNVLTLKGARPDLEDEITGLNGPARREMLFQQLAERRTTIFGLQEDKGVSSLASPKFIPMEIDMKQLGWSLNISKNVIAMSLLLIQDG